MPFPRKNIKGKRTVDPAGLTILLKELQADSSVAADAASKAAIRIRQESPGHLEACAYELARFYNILEKMLERICDGFENRLEKRSSRAFFISSRISSFQLLSNVIDLSLSSTLTEKE